MRCRGFGLEIASDIAIPGAVASAESAAPPELTIAMGAARLGPDALDFPPYRRRGQQLELVVPGIASYSLFDPNRLIVCAQTGAAESDVGALLVASGIPMALWARGGLVLHASGVVLPGSEQTIALAGASGSGKSTLARAMVESGATLVGDDTLWLREQSDRITASGLPGGLFGPDIDQIERAFWRAPQPDQADTAPLGAIVILDPALPAGEPQLLTGPAALAALLRHRHRPRIPALLGIEADRFSFAALLCSAVPVYALGGAPEALVDRLTPIRGIALAAP